ncbi:thioredoxin-like domain-containing protein [Flavobacterium sp. MMLR14_040]|uniref:peroxiredoxin family protein n=1 Tax=Flavobacterium sp. MMLR14_040 TaxID=3093843 RepID=UPI00298FD1E0|nr:redoxin domain-containing protein [Flavobacterium sp. MMLR14_040]MDW8850986.1 thioredoxin-like domain-containing protein [Flavobacterium sp. MMLR14_040]
MTNSIAAQTIQLSFPHFAGKEYTYVIVKGDKNDTITAKGKLDSKGKTVLQLPPSQKGYVGMSSFRLREGGGLDIVLNNENFTISCTEAQPTMENIKFTGSPENEFLARLYQKQQQVLNKVGIINGGLQLYGKNDSIYPAFQKELIKLKQRYAAVQLETAQSRLYAARFREMNDFLMGTASRLDQTEAEKSLEFREFMRSKINMQELYNSNLWSSVISSWLSMHESMVKNDALLLEDAKVILDRISSKEVYTAFADKLVVWLSAKGKDDLIGPLGTYMAASGKIENPGHNLLAAMGGPQTGMKAPDLVWKDGNYSFDKKQKTLLIFYETGCNNCDNEINLLIGNYQELQKKGYEVVTAASDVDPSEFEKNAARFPWTKKFCDFRGQGGYNFISFGVIGTPTIFVIDENGTITGRYARLADARILN